MKLPSKQLNTWGNIIEDKAICGLVIPANELAAWDWECGETKSVYHKTTSLNFLGVKGLCKQWSRPLKTVGSPYDHIIKGIPTYIDHFCGFLF